MKIEKKSAKHLETVEMHPKTWGYEVWIQNNGQYCGKLLHFNKYGATSLHYHQIKHETMYLQSGHLEIYMIDTETALPYRVVLEPGDAVEIPVGQPHQIIALEDSDLFEFSTTHYDYDSYRITREVPKNARD